MTRLFAAAVLLSITAAPAFACEWNQSVSTDAKPTTVAAQPAGDQNQATPPPTTPDDQKPS
jgi:hypothetical protein